MKSDIAVPVILAATGLLVAYLLVIWWLDRYEREPLWLTGLVFVWGASIGVGCGCGLNLVALAPLRALLEGGPRVGFAAIAIAPVAEELTKGLVFVPLVYTDHFDNTTDGLIYGAASGLGFATVENLLYFTQFAASPDIAAAGFVGMVAARTFFTAVMHAISTAILGMAVGYARHRSEPRKWLYYPAVGYALAVITHAIWNAASVFSRFHAGFQFAGALLIILAAALLFALTQWSLKREHDVIREQLHREAERGVIPHEHADIIPYWTRRRRSGWVPDGVDREAYIQAATLLAFRLHQLDLHDGPHAQTYRDDIQHYRNQIRALLS